MPMEAKPFQLGVRIEQPQTAIDQVRFGPNAGHPALGAADYSASVRAGNRDLFTFCMCAGRLRDAQRERPRVLLHQWHERKPPRFTFRQQRPSRDHRAGGNRQLAPTRGNSLPAAGGASGITRQVEVRTKHQSSGRAISWPAGRVAASSPVAIVAAPCPSIWRPCFPTSRRRIAEDRPAGNGSTLRQAVSPRRHAHRPRVARQLAGPNRTRPTNEAKPKGRWALPVRRRSRLRRRNRERRRRWRADRTGDCGKLCKPRVGKCSLVVFRTVQVPKGTERWINHSQSRYRRRPSS